jgi:hypothetical protein
MAKRKGDFSAKTRKYLADSVNWMCSICHKQTMALTTSRRSISRVGQACHIFAASEEGPRFNATLSWDDCRSADNGIWLCNICATHIDRDIETYTAGYLQELKANAEARSTENLGGRLLTQREANSAAYQLHREINGAPLLNPQGTLDTLVQGYTASLEEKDHRLSVTSDITSNRIETVIRRKKNKPFSLEITSIHPSDENTFKKMQALIEDGTTATFSSKDIKVGGSSLLKHALESSEGIKIGLNERIAKFSLRAISKDNKAYLLGHSAATFSIGITRSTLSGEISKIIKADLIQRLIKPYTYTLNLEINLFKWSSQPIVEIDDLDWLCQCFGIIADGGRLQFQQEEDSYYYGILIDMPPDVEMVRRLGMASIVAPVLKQASIAFETPIYFMETDPASEALRSLDFLTQLRESKVVFKKFENRTTELEIPRSSFVCKILESAIERQANLVSFSWRSEKCSCSIGKTTISTSGIIYRFLKVKIELKHKTEQATEFTISGSKGSEIEYEAIDFNVLEHKKTIKEDASFPKFLLEI